MKGEVTRELVVMYNKRYFENSQFQVNRRYLWWSLNVTTRTYRIDFKIDSTSTRFDSTLATLQLDSTNLNSRDSCLAHVLESYKRSRDDHKKDRNVHSPKKKSFTRFSQYELMPNKREWNNCFVKFSTWVILIEYFATFLDKIVRSRQAIWTPRHLTAHSISLLGKKQGYSQSRTHSPQDSWSAGGRWERLG